MRTRRFSYRSSGSSAWRRRAFSLMELATVIVIISTLSTIAVPKLTNSIANHSVDAAARRIAADLEYLKGRAVKTSSAQTFRIAPTVDPSYTLVGLTHPDSDSRNYTISFSKDCHGVTLSSYSLGGDNDLIYDMYGTPDTSGQLIITRGGQSRTISIAATSGLVSSAP